jgi:hypothetical protein
MMTRDQAVQPGDRAPAEHAVRRRVLYIAGGVVAAGLIVGGLVVAGIQGTAGGGSQQPGAAAPAAQSSSPATSPSTTPSPSGSAPAVAAPKAPAPSSGAVDHRFGQPVAKTVSTTEVAKTPTGLAASITSLSSVTATASQPGEVGGPAVKVVLHLTNDTAKTISLDAVTVNGYYGKSSTPAGPITTDSAVKPFHGSLKQGASASATYIFTMPTTGRDPVVITLSDSAGSPLVVFH